MLQTWTTKSGPIFDEVQTVENISSYGKLNESISFEWKGNYLCVCTESANCELILHVTIASFVEKKIAAVYVFSVVHEAYKSNE